MPNLTPEAPATHGVSRRPALLTFLSALGFAVLSALAFHPFNLWWLAPAAVAPVIWFLRAAGPTGLSPLRATLLATLGCTPFWAFEQRWVLDISGIGFFPLTGYLALTSGAMFGLLLFLHRRHPRVPLALLVPVVWVGVEYFRGAMMWDGYPWYMLAHPLIEWPSLAAPAAWIGAYGVSFLVSLGIASVADALTGRRVAGALGLLVCASVWLSAAFLQGPLTGEPVRLAALQTNVRTAIKNEWTAEQRVDDFRDFLAWTRALVEEQPPEKRPVLIAWPETMYPGYYLQDSAIADLARRRDLAPALIENVELFRQALLTVQSRIGVPMIVGASAYENVELIETPNAGIDIRHSRRLNSAFLINNGRVQPDYYAKLHLTPFGEYMPYISLWPWLERQMLTIGLGASGMRFDLGHGESTAPLIIPHARSTIRIATPICFEVTIPSVCRRLIASNGTRKADLMVQITNDGWFGAVDAGRRQHLQLARWRAVELATPILRSANTGVSAAIDAHGRLVASGTDQNPGAARVGGVLTAEIPLASPELPIYARIGDAVGWLSFSLLAIGTLAALVRRTPASPAPTSPAP